MLMMRIPIGKLQERPAQLMIMMRIPIGKLPGTAGPA